MSKQIKIPSGFGNPVNVLLNGIKYTYTAGAVETVPDEVAALFESNALNAVKIGRRAVAQLEAPERKGSSDGVALLVDDKGNLYSAAGGGPVPTEEKAATDESVTLQENQFLIFPEMDELTVDCPATGGVFAFRFTSGETPTVFSMPGIVLPDDFETEANKVYEVNVLEGYALIASWAVDDG